MSLNLIMMKLLLRYEVVIFCISSISYICSLYIIYLYSLDNDSSSKRRPANCILGLVEPNSVLRGDFLLRQMFFLFHRCFL